MVSITDKITELIQPILDDLDLELVDLEYKREQNGWILRFFLDKEGGITLDNCAEASREISSLLDVEDVIQTAYNLEVSSPGIERPLKTKEHFLRFVGESIKVKTILPVTIEDGKKPQKTFAGILKEVNGDIIKVQLQGRAKPEVELNLDQIEKANLKFEF